jgi:uncharacterized sulfatase
VPLVVRIPEQFRTAGQGKPGAVDGQLVSLIDLGPTMLNLAGVPIPEHFQGRAFLGPNLKPEREAVYGGRDRMDERYDSVRTVRDRRYRYLRNFQPHLPYAQHTAYMEEGFVMKELRHAQKEGKLPAAAKLYMGDTKPVEELYDLLKDPHELKNLAGSSAHRKVLERMRAMQEKWAMDTRDVGLIPEPDLETRGKKAGTRYQVFRQPGSERILRDLRTLVDAVNRGSDPKLVLASIRHPDPAFRYWALVGLGKTIASARAATLQIVKATSDPTPTVRIAALRVAALQLGDDSAVPRLAAEMKSENVYVRLHAAQALDALGPRAAAAREVLKAALTDPSEYVKRVAEHAMAALPAA